MTKQWMKRSYIKRTPFKHKSSHKRLKPIGKVGKATMAATAQWRKDNPPNHQGYYICYICGKWITPEELNVEHTKSKARHPELRTDQSKFKPCCSDCNEKKGSHDN